MYSVTSSIRIDHETAALAMADGDFQFRIEIDEPRLVCSYKLATRCVVLTLAMLLWAGYAHMGYGATGVAHGEQRSAVRCTRRAIAAAVGAPIGLREAYAMSGTDLAMSGNFQPTQRFRQNAGFSELVGAITGSRVPTVLGGFYAMSGADIGHVATRYGH
eukprot:3911859-Rhodomonas_salina.1